jgi:hypothetical protein
MSLLEQRHSVRRRSAVSSAGGVTTLAAALALATSAGCDSGVDLTPIEPHCTQQLLERIFPADEPPLAIDLLFVIDNSRSMADKQAILALAVPDLVMALVNPPCVEPNGALAPEQPKGSLDPCPLAGTWRSAEPILDMHIGIISSSLGGHGSDACPDQTSTCPAGPNYSNNDKGHLLSREDPCGAAAVPTWQGKGFLAWDPTQNLAPPGEMDGNNVTSALRNMVVGVGQVGCGYEAQLESWYRFLVDSEPYETITVVGGHATPQGLDQTLLAQRADFLRPGSLLAIIMLSDENDCSVIESGQFFFATQQKHGNGTPFHLPKPRAVCAANPNDPCCASCGQQNLPAECGKDDTCFDANGNLILLGELEDTSNLRCFDQKRRFGIDFLYPIRRYTDALTSSTVKNREHKDVTNPIFSDLIPNDENSNVRDPSLVFLAGIVGVPWQDIARNPADLGEGFKTSDELLTENNGVSTWDIILGDPQSYVAPQDPHMIEAIDPRTGQNPITGDAIVPVDQPPTNPINGKEYTIAMRDDLQYACIFPLPQPRDCADPAVSCDCKDPINDNPLCEEKDPAISGNRTLQTKAKAYPGLRELSVLKSLGSQGITASVCPAQVSSLGALDFGYRPMIEAIAERLKTTVRGGCLPRSLDTDDQGRVECLMVNARAVPGGACSCDPAKGRVDVTPEGETVVSALKADPNKRAEGYNCFCEIPQLKNTGEDGQFTGDLDACQSNDEAWPKNASGERVHGWCYVDATVAPPIGNPAIVADCPDIEKRLIRFVGHAINPMNGANFVACGDLSCK